MKGLLERDSMLEMLPIMAAASMPLISTNDVQVSKGVRLAPKVYAKLKARVKSQKRSRAINRRK